MHLNVPAVAFSGADGSTAQEAWTDLSTAPTSATVVGAETYAAMTTKFLHALFAQPPTSPALLPADTLLNVNFPPPLVSDTVLAELANATIPKKQRMKTIADGMKRLQNTVSIVVPGEGEIQAHEEHSVSALSVSRHQILIDRSHRSFFSNPSPISSFTIIRSLSVKNHFSSLSLRPTSPARCLRMRVEALCRRCESFSLTGK